MKIYCFWECRQIGALFLVDTVDVVEVCPFHSDELPTIDEDTGERYANHFESGHLSRVFSERVMLTR